MKISDVMRRKGSNVATIAPNATVRELLAGLAEHGVGALVVVDGGAALTGIVSERDIVRQLHARGADLLDVPVAQIMTADVATCEPSDSVESVMRLMTDRRFRHLPVLDGGQLAGIVSIGDIVKSRIDDLVTTTEHLESYIAGA